MKKLLTSLLFVTVVASSPLLATAQELQSLKVVPSSAAVGQEVLLTATFDISKAMNCNVRVEFGDGAQQNFVVNQEKDATLTLKHRYAKAGRYTVSVLPRTAMPALKCTGDDRKVEVNVAAAAPMAAAAKAPTMPAAQCPAGWALDGKSVNRKTGAFTCRADAGTAAPSAPLDCGATLKYFDSASKGRIGCRK